MDNEQKPALQERRRLAKKEWWLQSIKTDDKAPTITQCL